MQSYPQVMHSGRKATEKSYPQVTNRVMHCGAYTTVRLIHIEQNPVAKTGLGWNFPAPILTILFGGPRVLPAHIL